MANFFTKLFGKKDNKEEIKKEETQNEKVIETKEIADGDTTQAEQNVNELVQEDNPQYDSLESADKDANVTVGDVVHAALEVEENPNVEETIIELEKTEALDESKEVVEQEAEPVTEHEPEVIEERPELEGEADKVEVNPVQDVQQEQLEEAKGETAEFVEKPKGFFAKLKDGLFKTRQGINDKINSVLANFRNIDDELFEELEEMLIISDIGVQTTQKIVENLKKKVKLRNIQDPQDIKGLLKEEIGELLKDNDSELNVETSPTVIVIVGVNGVGKTTSIGKIAHRLKLEGKNVIVAAGDTFRAAAIDQLEVWGRRVGVDVVKHREGADPGAVIFDAIQAAKSRNADVLICDTAGRLHNKKNLMDELSKVQRIIERELPNSAKEVLLVVDATTGQNAVQQARTFDEAANLSGIILTKLDGTAKGGIIITIKSELDIPVKFVGVGEGMEDLQKFNSDDFASALFED